MSTPRSTEFYYSTTSANSFFTTMLIGGVVCMALSLFSFWHVGFSQGLLHGILVNSPPLLLGLFFFGFGYWKKRRAETNRSARLTITPEHIFAPDAARLPIPWAAIQKLVLHRARGRQHAYLALDVTNASSFKPQSTNKYFAVFNRLIGGGAITINTGDLDASHAEVKSALERANARAKISEK